MLMQTNLLMNNIRTNSVDLLKVQNQLTTGLKLARPSDNPAEASTIMHLDGVLESQKQYLNNISYATDFLASTDTAMSQIVELTSEAHTLALGSIGDQRALEPLVEKTLESDRFLQRCAQWAIQRLQDRTTPPFEWYPQICSDLIVP